MVKEITSRIEASPGWTEAKTKYLKGSKRGPDKYFNTHVWVSEAFRRWDSLQRFVPTNIKVLDIGAGFGYFAIVGRELGNQVELADVSNPLYDTVTSILGLSKHELDVSAFTPIQLQSGRYDLVTAYRIVFDKDWKEDEWRFFLRDVRNSLLNEGGSIVLGFNDGREKLFMEWAESLGARRINRRNVFIPYEVLNG